MEIKNSWSDFCRKEDGKYQGKELRARPERHPDVNLKYTSLGKITDWLKEKYEKFEPKTFWGPDFLVYVATSPTEGPHGVKPTGILCEVQDKGHIKWDPVGLQALSLSEAEAKDALAKYRRPRRQ